MQPVETSATDSGTCAHSCPRERGSVIRQGCGHRSFVFMNGAAGFPGGVDDKSARR
jgi:hypothetical protein